MLVEGGSGDVAAALAYGPLGRVLERTNAGGAHYRFTGHEAESQTGFQARLYGSKGQRRTSYTTSANPLCKPPVATT